MTDIPLPAQGSQNWYAWASEQEDLSDATRDDVSGTGIANLVKITQAAYDALGTKDAATFYVIVG